MNYRIRSSVTENATEKDATYRLHLKKYDKSNESDLWRYFYWDFFHDGSVENISFSSGLREVSFEIECPNIKRKLTEHDYEYVNAKFICRFLGVRWFALEHDVEEESIQECRAYFLSSEINSLDEFIEKYSDHEDDYGEMSSLIIELNSGFMDIVFRTMRVEAVEPLAFSLMLTDVHHDVPIFLKEHETS